MSDALLVELSKFNSHSSNLWRDKHSTRECSHQIEQNIVKLIKLKFSSFVGDHVELAQAKSTLTKLNKMMSNLFNLLVQCQSTMIKL